MAHEDAHIAADPNAGYERQDVNLPIVAAAAAFTILIVVISFFWLDALFVQTKEDLYRQQVLETPNDELVALRAAEHEKLTTFGIVDPEKQWYRMPIDRAMQRLAEQDANRRRQ